jgi:hypothetical protein
LRWKRIAGTSSDGAGCGAATGAGMPPLRMVRSASATIASWSTDPAAEITTCRGT